MQLLQLEMKRRQTQTNHQALLLLQLIPQQTLQQALQALHLLLLLQQQKMQQRKAPQSLLLLLLLVMAVAVLLLLHLLQPEVVVVGVRREEGRRPLRPHLARALSSERLWLTACAWKTSRCCTAAVMHAVMAVALTVYLAVVICKLCDCTKTSTLLPSAVVAQQFAACRQA
jgi:hypothetical protein